MRNIASLTYNFILYTDLVDDNCYNYKFFDTVEEEIRDCRIYSPFTHIQGSGFESEGLIGTKGKDNVSVRLFDN